MKNAEESRQIAKARRKLKKRLEIIDRQFTSTALEEVVERMHSLLEQSAAAKSKKLSSSLFDQNTHSAQVSHSVNRLREQLAQRLEQERSQLQSLAGRVSLRK